MSNYDSTIESLISPLSPRDPKSKSYKPPRLLTPRLTSEIENNNKNNQEKKTENELILDDINNLLNTYKQYNSNHNCSNYENKYNNNNNNNINENEKKERKLSYNNRNLLRTPPPLSSLIGNSNDHQNAFGKNKKQEKIQKYHNMNNLYNNNNNNNNNNNEGENKNLDILFFDEGISLGETDEERRYREKKEKERNERKHRLEESTAQFCEQSIRYQMDLKHKEENIEKTITENRQMENDLETRNQQLFELQLTEAEKLLERISRLMMKTRDITQNISSPRENYGSEYYQYEQVSKEKYLREIISCYESINGCIEGAIRLKTPQNSPRKK